MSITPLPPISPATTHDVGLFALSAPPGWSLQRLTDDTYVLTDPQHEVALTLLVAPYELPAKSASPTQHHDVHAELARWLARHPHVKIKRAPRSIAGQIHPTLANDGLQRLRTPLSTLVPPFLHWILRPFRAPQTLLWRFWAVLGPRAAVLARAAGRPDTLEQFSPLLDRIVGSLRLPASDLLTGSRFANAVLSLAKNRFPDALLALADDDTLKIGSSPISLRALRLRYLEAPTQLPAHARHFFAALSTELPAADLADAWSAARDAIMPVLLTPAALNNAPERLVSEQWINNLSVGYVLERSGDPERPITAADSHHWGVSVDTLHDQALSNLIRRSKDQTMQGQKNDEYTMLVLAAPDRHNAARILLPEFYHRLRQHLGGTFYAAVPSRELLVAFTANRDDLRDRLRKQIADDYCHAKNALSDKLFLVTPDGIAGDPDEAEDFIF
jgi:hypothetical protein